MDFNPIIDEIVAELNTLPQDVYVGQIPDDEVLRMQGSKILPHIIFMWTNPVRSGRGRGIVSARDDMYRMSCTVHCVAPSSDDARALQGKVLDLLTAFQPHNSSELIPWGGFSTNSASSNAKPTKYIHSQGFQFHVNTILETT